MEIKSVEQVFGYLSKKRIIKMKLPIGLLSYWAHRFDEDNAMISGMWYYKENYVPSTREEKKHSILDLKAKRCTVLNIHGTFSQILDLLKQADKFQFPDPSSNSRFDALVEELKNAPEYKAYIFDDINNIKGTAFRIDTSVEIDENMEEVMSEINKGKPVSVTISKGWSFENELVKYF